MELMKAEGPIEAIGLMEPMELMELMKLMWLTELLGSMERAWRSAAAQWVSCQDEDSSRHSMLGQ